MTIKYTIRPPLTGIRAREQEVTRTWEVGGRREAQQVRDRSAQAAPRSTWSAWQNQTLMYLSFPALASVERNC